MTIPSEEIRNLAVLFGEREQADFLASYWPSRFYLTHGPEERLKGVFPCVVDDLLQLQCSSLRALNPLPSGVTEGFHANYNQALPLYRSGMTLYFHDLQSPAFQLLASAVDAWLGLCGGLTRISAFASSRGIGVATHYDLNDNFVVQVKGTKRWRLATNPSVVNPSFSYRLDQPASDVHVMEAGGPLPDKLPDDHVVFDLKPGSVAYVPRGCLHQCETVDEESLHFNVQTAMLTMSDLMVYALVRMVRPQAPELRARLHHAFEQGALSGSLQESLRAELSRLEATLRGVDLAIAEDAIQRFVRSADRESLLGKW
jgi:50S ribosomal protein L16 3-hydroxylase